MIYHNFVRWFLLPGGYYKGITYRPLGKSGRLGNQLWQIASTIALGQKYKLKVILPNWSYMPFFSFPDLFFEKINSNYKLLDSSALAPHLKNQAHYLQDFNLIKDISLQLKDWTRLSRSSDLEMVEVLTNKYDFSNRHAMHIRLGDYNAKNSIHVIPPISWYEKQIQHNTLVFTDQPDLVKRIFPKVHIFENQPDYITLTSMSKCATFTISASTFSWWSAFLSDSKQVVYPTPWSYLHTKEWNTPLLIPPYFKKLPINIPKGQ